MKYLRVQNINKFSGYYQSTWIASNCCFITSYILYFYCLATTLVSCIMFAVVFVHDSFFLCWTLLLMLFNSPIGKWWINIWIHTSLRINQCVSHNNCRLVNSKEKKNCFFKKMACIQKLCFNHLSKFFLC